MESINDGTLTDWAVNRLAEKVVYIIASRVYDPSEDYVFIGRESYLKWYNNFIVPRLSFRTTPPV
ncbi:hypothetical protein DIPPA_27163 [Diplonema papillatum]|nr:hypothetical protein DIPPA_27163 [Diplonema papillatum]